MAKNKIKNKPAPEVPPEAPPEETPEAPPEETPEETLLIVTKKVALGNGTREPGFILGEVRDPENLSVDEITPADGVEVVEIINALNNPDVYKVQE